MTWAPEAEPQGAEEVCSIAAPCPEVVEAAEELVDITSIVHFTRIRWAGGHHGQLCGQGPGRFLIAGKTRLKYVYEENAPDRSRDVLLGTATSTCP